MASSDFYMLWKSPDPKDSQIGPASKAKFVENQTFLCGNFIPFISKIIQIWDHFLPLVFPKDAEILKSLDIGLHEVGATKLLNGVNKEKKVCKQKISPRRF